MRHLRRTELRYPELWRKCVFTAAPCLGPSGNFVRDLSGNKYNIDTFGGSGTTFDPNGTAYCCNMNGSGRIYTSQTVAHGVGAGDFTVCMWVNPAAITNAYRCVWSNGTSSAPALYSTLVSGSGHWGIYWEGNKPSGVILSASQWQHVVVRRTSGLIEYFTNGVKSATTLSLSTSMSNAVFIIGNELTASQQAAYTGGWDDFRFYSRSLSDKSIALLASRRGIAYEMAPRRRTGQQGGATGAAIVTTRLTLIGTSRKRLDCIGTSAERLTVAGTSRNRLDIVGSSER